MLFQEYCRGLVPTLVIITTATLGKKQWEGHFRAWRQEQRPSEASLHCVCEEEQGVMAAAEYAQGSVCLGDCREITRDQSSKMFVGSKEYFEFYSEWDGEVTGMF